MPVTEGIEWDVALPERVGTRIGGRRPRATLCLETTEYGSERLEVPLAVGRRLSSARASGKLASPSRSELLSEAGAVERSCARERAGLLVGKRDYAARELVRRLLEDGYSHAAADEVVARFAELGIVDDERFSVAFARSKAASGWGRERVVRELSRRGVADEVIERALDEALGGQGERDRALAAARSRRFGGKDPFAQAVRFLCGRGFSLSLALDVARLVTDGDE